MPGASIPTPVPPRPAPTPEVGLGFVGGGFMFDNVDFCP